MPQSTTLSLLYQAVPSLIPDLNIMENIWKMITVIVYDGPQYDNYETLRVSIYEAARKINREKKR
jgi:hypothetical protein